MRALPDGGMTLTAAEAHVVSELMLRCSEDDYIALNLDEHCKGGLELAASISEHRRIAEEIRRTFNSEAADEMTDLELLGKVGDLLVRKPQVPVAPAYKWPVGEPHPGCVPVSLFNRAAAARG